MLATVRLAISVVKRDISSTSAQLLARSKKTMESAANAVKRVTNKERAHKTKKVRRSLLAKKLDHLTLLRRRRLQKPEFP